MAIFSNAEKITDTLYRFRENYSISKDNLVKLPLTEEKMLVEGKDYKTNGAYTFKIWEKGKFNLNERCYDKVIEKVLKESVTTIGLANHPKDEVDVLKTFAVSKNPRLVDNWLCADFYLVGDAGALAEEILSKGGVIGLSSSALGELDNDGYVKEDNFQLERYGDWVDYPSNGVFQNKEESCIKESININQDIEKDYIKNENIINYNNINLKNNRIKDMSKQSLEEKNFILSMNSLIEKAEVIPVLEDKIKSYEELLEWCDIDYGNEIKEKITTRLSELNNELKEFAIKGKETDGLKEANSTLIKENEDLKIRVEELSKISEESFIKLDELKDYSKKLKELYDVSNAKANSKKIDLGKFKSIYENYKQLKSRYLELKDSNTKKDNIIKLLTEEKETIDNEFKEYKEVIIKNRLLKKEKLQKDKIDAEKKFMESRIKVKEEKLKELELQKERDIDNNKLNNEVKELYSDWLKENPNVYKIKEQILCCKNIYEAQRKYLQLKDVIEESFDRGYVERKEFHSHLDNEDLKLYESKGIEESKSIQKSNSLNIPKGWI